VRVIGTTLPIKRRTEEFSLSLKQTSKSSKAQSLIGLTPQTGSSGFPFGWEIQLAGFFIKITTLTLYISSNCLSNIKILFM